MREPTAPRPRPQSGDTRRVAADTIRLAHQVADESLADANRLAAGLLATAERRAQETVDAARRAATEIIGRAHATVTDVNRAQHRELMAAFADTRSELAALVEASLRRIEARADDIAAECRARHAQAECSMDQLLRTLAEDRSRQRADVIEAQDRRSAAIERARVAHPAGPARPLIVPEPEPTPAPASVRIAGRPLRPAAPGRSAPVIELVRERGRTPRRGAVVQGTAIRRDGRPVAAS